MEIDNLNNELTGKTALVTGRTEGAGKAMPQIELPKIIKEYIAVSNQKDAGDIAKYFTDDATAKDEGKTYKGLQELKQWRGKTAAYNFNVEIINTDKKDNTYLVFARLTGDFPPPNPVNITYHFKMRDGKIANLYIG